MLKGGNIDKIKEAAISLSKSELVKLSKGHEVHSCVEMFVSRKFSWSELKRFIESKEGVTLSTSVLDSVIKNLEKMRVSVFGSHLQGSVNKLRIYAFTRLQNF